MWPEVSMSVLSGGVRGIGAPTCAWRRPRRSLPPRVRTSARLWAPGHEDERAVRRSVPVARAHGWSVPRRGAGNQMAPRDRSGSAGAAAPASTTSASTPGKTPAEAARAGVGRCQSAPESRREVADREARRTRPEVAPGRDPVDRARLVEGFGHVQLCALENTLRDPEGDPVDEVALPQLERRRRCFLQAREVGEVATEG